VSQGLSAPRFESLVHRPLKNMLGERAFAAVAVSTMVQYPSVASSAREVSVRHSQCSGEI